MPPRRGDSPPLKSGRRSGEPSRWRNPPCDSRRPSRSACSFRWGRGPRTGRHDAEDADSGQTRSLDSYESRETRSLDSGDTESADDQGQVDSGSTAGPDSAEKEKPQPVAAPAPPPQVGSAEQREEAKRIHDEAATAAHRLETANAAYSQMMSRGYPAGEERAKIIQERDAARTAYEQANARYTALLEHLGH